MALQNTKDAGKGVWGNPACALAILRIAVGLWFVYGAFAKFALPFGLFFGRTIVLITQDHPWDWYRAFVFSVVVPNHVLVAQLIAWTEAALALSLTLGLFVRPVCVLGLLVIVPLLLAEIHLGELHVGAYGFEVATILAFLIGDAGRVWGLDKLLSDNAPAKKEGKKIAPDGQSEKTPADGAQAKVSEPACPEAAETESK